MRSVLLLAFLLAITSAAEPPPPPEPRREFRGAWVASVHNLDWPSRPGLPLAKQKAELAAILDRAAGLKLNAILLQVRPACDALYASELEPWSAFLTGKQGVPPAEGWDPLAWAVEQAHARGLELHAWFNPFRAATSAGAALAPTHVARRHPEWARRYGGQLWLDPGEPGARQHARDVILDVVRRYDLDGAHIDDYFYPYPAKGGEAFPDDSSWERAGRPADRGAWRRANIDRFVEELYAGIKATKRWVKFGISPFGIWRPGVPPSTEAQLDAFTQLSADSRRWFAEGWCDYFAPQLYWAIDPPAQSFPVLLSWWGEQNRAGRHLWPGIATDRVGATRPAREQARQIALTRETAAGPVGPGHIHWNMKALGRDQGGVARLLAGETYAAAALVPASPWLGSERPPSPRVTRDAAGGLQWAPGGEDVRWWLVQTRGEGGWKTERLPVGTRAHAGGAGVVVRAVSRTGVLSALE